MYLIAFSIIALVIVVAQLLIQEHLDTQLDDARIVNISGRQRMLGQKMVKELLYAAHSQSREARLHSLKILRKDIDTFQVAHAYLQKQFRKHRNLSNATSPLETFFSQVEQSHKQLVMACTELQHTLAKNPDLGADYFGDKIDYLQQLERRFLQEMDATVLTYDEISLQKISVLKQKEYVLFSILLLVLFLELIFLVRPASRHLKEVVEDLVVTKKEAQDNLVEVETLHELKEKSLQELKGLSYAIDNAALFASITREGSLVHISKKFSRLLGIKDRSSGNSFFELLQLDAGEQQTIMGILKGKGRSIWNGELRVSNAENQPLWLDMSIIPMNQVNAHQRILILCTDITERKASQQEIDLLNEQRFKEQVDLQKTQASQIVNAQEEERNRIAKDIHDGIGQMLTALKFNLESINVSHVDAAALKVTRLKELLGNLIKEVRAVTFNLTPPELRDYGIVPALNKLTGQLSKLTGKNVLFENKTDFSGRFDSLVEINLYRVVQEAVNNALKYAQSNYILVQLNHSASMLSIVVDDDGIGFDRAYFEKKKEEGMGLFFMKERIHYINGRFFISSTAKKGTRITINISLEQMLS